MALPVCVPLTFVLTQKKTMPKSELDRPNNSSNVFQLSVFHHCATQKALRIFVYYYLTLPPPTRKLLGCWIDRITCGRVAALVRTPLHTQKMTKQGKDKLDGLGARVVGLIPAFAHFMIIIGGIMSSLGGHYYRCTCCQTAGNLKKKVLIENVAPFMWCVVTAARRNLNEKNEK
jgi:hypothetical protein